MEKKLEKGKKKRTGALDAVNRHFNRSCARSNCRVPGGKAGPRKNLGKKLVG